MLQGSVLALASRAFRGSQMRSVDRLELERGGIAGEKDRSFHRQVTLLDEASWSAATAEVGIDLGWMYRRANVFVKGVDLQAYIGTRIR